MGDVVGVKVGGSNFVGWKSVTITRGVKALAGSFELGVSERWAKEPVVWPIQQEDACEVSIDGEVLISGFIDRKRIRYDATNHELTIAGRDAPGAMVDCSAILPHASGKGRKWELGGAPLKTVAKELAAQFGIALAVDSGLTFPTPPKKFVVNPGDTSFDVLERGCRMAGVLAVSDGQGGITLMRPGAEVCQTDLVEGQNILSADADFNVAGRYRTYIVQGQHPGDDNYFGKAPLTVEGQATDESVARTNRVLLVRPEGAVDAAYAELRAQWEATVRAAKGDAITITVQGWRQGDGSLWPINARVKVRSPSLRLNGQQLLIVEATYGRSAEAGTTTTLSLARPESYFPEPVITKGSIVGYKPETKGGV